MLEIEEVEPQPHQNPKPRLRRRIHRGLQPGSRVFLPPHRRIRTQKHVIESERSCMFQRGAFHRLIEAGGRKR